MSIQFSKPLVALLVLMGAVGQGQADTPKPDLIVVSIGVSKFEFAPFEAGVQFAAKDASDVARQFKAQQGKLFSEVRCKLLTDSEATLANVYKALVWAKAN